ncbi:MAG: proteasome assembly chaperone family protein [Candidatus Heimdallarchaeota archaeon]|nr:proteasome assembly chaperone family protein [Candidatus Heimdallarchaeota archaeon]
MSAPESKAEKSTIEFILFDEEQDLTDCVLVGGYFGLGRVGYLSINHLLNHLDVRLIGYINSDFIPPFVSISNEKIRAPFELYRYNNLLILATHFEPYKYEQRSIAEAIVKWAKIHEIAHIVQIGGLDKRYQSDEEFDLTIVKTKAYDQESLGPKVPLMDEGLYVTGPAALVMLYAEFYHRSAVLLLPYAERARPDPSAAALALKTLGTIFDIKIDIEELEDEGKSLEIEEQGAKDIAEKTELLENSDHGMFV